MPLHARRRDLVHAGRDPGGALAAVVVERADVDQRRAAQDDGLTASGPAACSVDGELRQPGAAGCARAPIAADGRPARAARSAPTAATRARRACRSSRRCHWLRRDRSRRRCPRFRRSRRRVRLRHFRRSPLRPRRPCRRRYPPCLPRSRHRARSRRFPRLLVRRCCHRSRRSLRPNPASLRFPEPSSLRSRRQVAGRQTAYHRRRGTPQQGQTTTDAACSASIPDLSGERAIDTARQIAPVLGKGVTPSTFPKKRTALVFSPD